MNIRRITTLNRALREVTREVDRDLPITILLVLIAVAVAGDEGTDQGVVMENLELSSAGISRAVQTLGAVHYLKGKPGLGLVTREFDPTDNRRRVLKLTPAGRKLIGKVTGAMED